MNHFTWDQLPQLLAALLAAVSAFVAAWKSHQTHRIAEAIEQRLLTEIIRQGRFQPAPVIPPAPTAEAPGMGINDALRYWDLISKLKAVWTAVKGQPVGVMGSLPLIKGVKIDGRTADLGPTPIVFR